jgi:hypothetical protein
LDVDEVIIEEIGAVHVVALLSLAPRFDDSASIIIVKWIWFSFLTIHPTNKQLETIITF